jgi:ectoine hydroxylase-related dioxygenase (phytanoyl-CoA dioxygenase family)
MEDLPKLVRDLRRDHQIAFRPIVFRVKLKEQQKRLDVIGLVVVATVAEAQVVATVVGYFPGQVVESNSKLGVGLGLPAHRIQGRILSQGSRGLLNKTYVDLTDLHRWFQSKNG